MMTLFFFSKWICSGFQMEVLSLLICDERGTLNLACETKCFTSHYTQTNICFSKGLCAQHAEKHDALVSLVLLTKILDWNLLTFLHPVQFHLLSTLKRHNLLLLNEDFLPSLAWCKSQSCKNILQKSIDFYLILFQTWWRKEKFKQNVFQLWGKRENGLIHASLCDFSCIVFNG